MPYRGTARDILARYADTVATVAGEAKPALDLDAFARHLAIAADRVTLAQLPYADDVRTALAILTSSESVYPTDQVRLGTVEHLLFTGDYALTAYLAR